MYTSLRELIGGWRKNLFAGGRHSMPLGAKATALAPLLLPLPFLMQLVPATMLVVAIVFNLHALLIWSSISVGVTLLSWLVYYRTAQLPVGYALLYPVGAAVALYIALSAIIRGSRVEWKGREYESANPASV